MSWETQEGNSRRPIVSWVVPDHLRERPRPGVSRCSLIRPPLDPDTLLDYTDNAISVTEYAQATKHLSRLFPSSAVFVSSSSSSASSLSLSSSSTSAPAAVGATPRSSSRSFVPVKNLEGCEKQPSLSVCEEASRLDLPSISEMEEGYPLEDESIDGDSDVKEEGKGVKLDNDKSLHDAQAADDAYRTACSALSEGHAEMAVSLLHLALAKCPPDKHIAVGKVRRVMVAAMQLVEKKSAVLRSLPVDKDAC